MTDRSLEHKLDLVHNLCCRINAPEYLRRLCLTRMRRGHEQHGDDMSHLDLPEEARREIADAVNYISVAVHLGRIGRGHAVAAAVHLVWAYDALTREETKRTTRSPRAGGRRGERGN